MTSQLDTEATSSTRPKLFLSASGGGHFRQLLDLKPLWENYPHVIVTEPSVLARSFADREPMEFLPHFAVGQLRMGKALAFFGAVARSFIRSARIVLKHRPDVVISTGAGSQSFLLLWARLTGTKVVLIDSFARFHAPSKFARFAGWLAHRRIAQSASAARQWRGSVAFDPLKIEAPRKVDKEDLLVATVGAVLPFDRLTAMVVDAKRRGVIATPVIAQIGRGAAPIAPTDGLSTIEEMPFDELNALLDRARVVVCHGGTGSILTALKARCKVIAVPRTVAAGDAYDDHQFEIAQAFAERGLLSVATDQPTFDAAIAQIDGSPAPSAFLDQRDMIAYLDRQIAAWTQPQAGSSAAK